MMNMVKHFYIKTLENEKKGKREMRFVDKIFKTTMKDPEYIAKKELKRQKEAEFSRNTIAFNTHSGMTSRAKFPARGVSLPTDAS